VRLSNELGRSDLPVATMSRTELIIQLVKVVIGVAFGAYFVSWSLEVLKTAIALETPSALIRSTSFRARIPRPSEALRELIRGFVDRIGSITGRVVIKRRGSPRQRG
jgi:hypothetical protein